MSGEKRDQNGTLGVEQDGTSSERRNPNQAGVVSAALEAAIHAFNGLKKQLDSAHNQGVNTDLVKGLGARAYKASVALCGAIRAVSQHLPHRMEARVYARVLDSPTFSQAMVDGLISQEDSFELGKIGSLYLTQLKDAIRLYSLDQSDSNFYKLDSIAAKILYLTSRLGDSLFSNDFLIDLVKSCNNSEIVDSEDRSAGSFLYSFLTDALSTSLIRQSAHTNREIFSMIISYSNADVLQVFSSLTAEQQSQLFASQTFIKEISQSKSQDLLIKMLSMLELDSRLQIIKDCLEHVSFNISDDEREGLEYFYFIRKLIDIMPVDQSDSAANLLITSWGAHPFSKKNAETLLQQLDILVENPILRSEIFWRIASDKIIYDQVDTNSLVSLIANFENFETKHLRIVSLWFKSGLIPLEIFLEKIIENIDDSGSDFDHRIHQLVQIAENYEVDPRLLKDQFEQIIKECIEADGEIYWSLQLYGHLFDSISIVGNWQEFKFDLQASLEYGDSTWRTEQSIIDLLQNHLDAEAYRHAVKLATAALKHDETRGGVPDFFSHDLNSLVAFSKRWPFISDDSVFLDSVIPTGYLDNPKELAEKIGEIEGPELPKIEVILSNQNGVERVVSIDNLEIVDEEWKIVGVRFNDSGYGYDAKLNAIFAPTKQNFSFMRGRFGQGTKISMIALLREGCEIRISSRTVEGKTGEVHEWSGSPKISSETVSFEGNKRRLFNPDDELGAGTTTEIRFNNADERVVSQFRSMLDSRYGEGLGRYVLDYHPLKDTFIYGSIRTQTSVSVRPELNGRVFVQGLEVPHSTDFISGFCYNFGSGEVLTGRDRTHLEREKIKEDIAYLWGGVTNQEALERLYILILSPRLRTVEHEVIPEGLDLTLMDSALPAHKEALSKVIGVLPEDDSPIVCVGSDELSIYPKDAKKILRDKGYPTLLEFGSKSYDMRRLISKVMGRDRVVDFASVWGEIQQGSVVEGRKVGERLKEQYESVVNSSIDYAVGVLSELGYSNAGDVTRSMELELIYDIETSNGAKQIIRSRQIRRKENQFKGSGYYLVFNPQYFDDNNIIPEELSQADYNRLRFAVESEILKLGYISVSRHEFIPSEQYIIAQGLANRLIAREAHRFGDSIEIAKKISIDSPVLEQVDRSIDEMMDGDRRIVEVREIIISLLWQSSDIEFVKNSIFKLGELASGSDDLILYVNTELMKMSLIGRKFFDGSKIWTLSKSENEQDLLTIKEVKTQEIGRIHDLPIYSIGSGLNGFLAVPFDFSNTETVVIRTKNSEHPISKYKRRSLQIPHILSDFDNIEDYFGKNGGTYFSEHVFVENGLIFFPIPSINDLAKNIEEYFDTELGVSFYTPGESEADEQNWGESYISTNASIEYGGGKVWDDPIRIFSDIVQNHLDAGNVEILYQLEGVDGWVGVEELLLEENRNIPIVGVQIKDDGSGYTTSGLTIWGDSAKKSGGKKGRFGEGMKMLSAACVRSGIGLSCSSRDWDAVASSREQYIRAHGRTKMLKMVGFDMKWRDEVIQGSVTTLSLPVDNDGRAQSWISHNNWKKWMDILDPRGEQDEKGNAGLSRYVRELRVENSDEIRVGPVTFLRDESGKFFERGLLVPDAGTRMGKKYFFGYDFDAEVIATQERNVLDRSKVNDLIIDAFRHAPYELCKVVMQGIYYSVMSGRPGIEGDFMEFELLHYVEDVEVLRLAYFEVFGLGATISSKYKAIQDLYRGRVLSESGNYVALSQRDHEFLRGLMVFEERNYSKDSLVVLGDKYPKLADRIEPHVPSTRRLYKKLFDDPLHIDADQLIEIQRIISVVANEMSILFSHLLESDQGYGILSDIISASDRDKYTNGRLGLSDNEIDYAMSFLSLVAEGQIKIDVNVLHELTSIAGFVTGASDITFSSSTFDDPGKAVNTIAHELLHLAFQTKDYNSAFYRLLLLTNPSMTNRYIDKDIS